MKKYLFAVLFSVLAFGCADDDSNSDDSKVYCSYGDDKLEHGVEAEPNPDEGYSHYCVVVNRKAVVEERCDKEGTGLIGKRFGVAGLYDIYTYDCIKDDDSHLYQSNKVSKKCADGGAYLSVNSNNEICVLLNNELVYKPVCPQDAAADDCLTDEGGTKYHK